MKVILTVHQFFPEHASGTEVLTLETAKGLRNRGHEVRIVTGFYHHEALADAERFDRYEYEGFKIDRFAFSPSPFPGNASHAGLEYRNPLFAERFTTILDEFRPDVVHFFHLMRLSSTFIDVCADSGIPTVFTPTDFWFVCPYSQLTLPDQSPCVGPTADAANCIRHMARCNQRRSPIFRLVNVVPHAILRLGLAAVRRNLHLRLPLPAGIRALGENARIVAERSDFLRARLNRIDRIIVPNHYMWDVLSRHGMNPDHALLQPFGINLKYQEDIPRTPSPVLRIGYIGTLGRHKGAHVLIDALRQLPSLRCEVKIYGPLTDFPDYLRELRKAAEDDDRIRFMGSFPNSEIGRVFSGLDVLVVPSVWRENTPLVIYSAQAAGCPVIGSDVGGIASAVENEGNGLLFPAGDAAALASCIERLATDEALLARLSEGAKPPVSIDEYCAVIENQYQALKRKAPQSSSRVS